MAKFPRKKIEIPHFGVFRLGLKAIVHCLTRTESRAVHSGGGGGGGGGGEGEAEGAAAPAGKTEFFFSNIVFEFAELFLVAILDRDHKKID